MNERLIDQAWWTQWEAYLRFQSFADAAWQAAHNPKTPRGLVQGLLERHARMALRAHAARDAAKALEPQ